MLFVKGMSGPKIREIQEALKELGYFTGTPQGNFGIQTESAVRAFQQFMELEVDGQVGDETWGTLFVPVVGTPQEAKTPLPWDKGLPPWLVEALRDLGQNVEEISGPEDNPDIVAYHQYTSLQAQDDETAWCASSLCAWLERAGFKSPRSAAAASFREWGKELPEGYQRLGCVVVMSRTGGNHVCIYLDEDDQGVYCVGGNQGDRVSIRRFSWANITDFRWPEGV